MHWLRIDRYYTGELDNPDTYLQPMPCQQCENAPCEVVCPVAATVHSDEGLNDMVYNRCVGTRYCSNNCPYKVRRFNFLLYQDWDTPSSSCSATPTSRCAAAASWRSAPTACSASTRRASRRSVRTARSATARCSPPARRSCPTDAIVFGNINDPNSRVAQLKASPRNYAMLAELNTRPRTTYLARCATRIRRCRRTRPCGSVHPRDPRRRTSTGSEH